MIVKVCGMRNAQNIRDVESIGVDWMGFIFYPKSKRYVSVVPAYLPQNTKRIGVFVNDTVENIKSISKEFQLDIVQLHGDESPDMCGQLSKNKFIIMKAFSVGDTFPVDKVASYQQVCQYFLFDTHTSEYGGSGIKFDWRIISDYKGDTPFMLSGGISVDDVKSIVKINHPALLGVDINSCFEHEPALKNISLIEQFIKQIKCNE